MAGTLLYAYLGGWILTSIGAALVAWRLQDKRDPASHPTLLSIVAGAAWPILVIAMAQAAVVALTQEVLHEDERVLSLVG